MIPLTKVNRKTDGNILLSAKLQNPEKFGKEDLQKVR